MDISDPAWGINTFDILNNLPIGVHIFDAKGMNSIFVNPKFLDIHEITREDVQDFGKFMAHVFPDSNQQEQFKQEFRETVVLSTPVKPFWVEKEIRIQNGKKRRVLITNIPFLNAENRELIACFAQDVTDRYEISEKMKELASLYQFINEYANDIIGIVDFNYKIIHINRAGINLLGYDVHEVIGQSIFQYVPERYHELMKAMANRKRTMNIPNTYYELELIDKKGFSVPFELVTTLLKKDEKFHGILIIGRDLRLRLELDREKQQAQRMESLGLLAGGIAHDFNNILMLLLGNISLLQTEIPSNSEVESTLQELEKGIFHAKNLTQQLLTFSKGGDPVKKIIDIKNLIQETVEFSLTGSNCKSRVSIDPALLAVNVDPVQIHQVLNNLLINAIQSMPLGGTIDIRVHNEDIPNFDGKLPQGKYIKIEVEDTGHGIPESLKPKLFSPYFTTKSKGSGLGLATCYSIIKKHAGWIGFESIEHRGTKFFIYLPGLDLPPEERCLFKFDKTQQETPNPQRDGYSSKRVLIVEDEENLRKILLSTLISNSFDVVAVPSGEEAIALFHVAQQRHPFQFVLLDFVLKGGMSGLECFKKIRQTDPQIQGLIMSGYSEEKITEKYKEYGFTAFLQKPFSIKQLITILRNSNQ